MSVSDRIWLLFRKETDKGRRESVVPVSEETAELILEALKRPEVQANGWLLPGGHEGSDHGSSVPWGGADARGEGVRRRSAPLPDSGGLRMAKAQVGPMEFLAETLQAMAHPGLLLVSRDGRGRPNAMTIGWGSVGIYWARPVFVVPVRKSRYTYGCIEKTDDFTVNVLPRKLADAATFCGTVSGRDHDKFAEAGLTTRLHAYGTNVEGDWDDVFAAVRRCHETLHEMGAPRISTIIKAGTRTDRPQSLDDKVRSVQDKL